ncbi:hypothetical protein [Thermococcus sp. P6]|uniref:hypothetical protein n=1 Tax=Thermococcus sp. P6 TaxID=122420 RepID=UPI0018DF3BD6|nr:hypothetical protein [Thermococcus sp. P6]
MERRTFYRVLLVIVLILALIYTLGIVGVLPFELSYYITIIMIMLFLYLRLEGKLRK